MLPLLPPPDGSQEHSNLSDALAQIRDIITAVDVMVGKYERSQELQEVLTRLETKSFAKLKNGKVFRKQDMHTKHRALQHKGLLYWKTATGRLKGVQIMISSAKLDFFKYFLNRSYKYISLVPRHFSSFAHGCPGFSARERPALHICICGKGINPNNALKLDTPILKFSICNLAFLGSPSGPEASSYSSAEAHC